MSAEIALLCRPGPTEIPVKRRHTCEYRRAMKQKGEGKMGRFSETLVALAIAIYAGNAAAQVPKPAPGAIKLQTAPANMPAANNAPHQVQPKAAPPVSPPPVAQTPAPIAGPAPATAPVAVNAPPDNESLIQAEIKRLEKNRDRINATLAAVGANFSKLTFSPATGNSCVDIDVTWNPRSGESFACQGMTTCIGRMSRWSKNRTNPCEPGVVIDSCVTTGECKPGFVCHTGLSTCIKPAP